MVFTGISKTFSLRNEDQYNTIGAFWEDMEAVYGTESLIGLGYKWSNGFIHYAIGLKSGEIENANLRLELPDDGWTTVEGLTEDLKAIYDEIYKDGVLRLELKEFTPDGRCKIRYLR